MVQSRKRKLESSHEATSESAKAPHVRDAAVAMPAQLHESFLEVVQGVEDYAFILLDATGTILTWNKGAEKIIGYSANDVVGKHYRILHTEEERELNLSVKLLEVAGKKGRANVETWSVRKDGTRYWSSVTLSAIQNDDGTIRAFLQVSRDLTEKKIAEDHYSNYVEELMLKNEEMRKNEDRYHKMITEVVDYAIILLDKEGKILEWNKGAERLKGYSEDEIVGKSFRFFYPKEEKDAQLPERLLAEAVRNGSVTHEGWRLRKDGTRFWGNVTLTALHDESGEVIGFSKVTRDHTQKKIAEDRVANALEALKQANEQLKESEQRYYKMIAEVQDYAILLLNTRGEIQNWNAGAESIKGYKAAEVVGKHFEIFYPEEDRQKKLPERLLQQAIVHGKAAHEGWRVRKDGSLFWGSVVITALHNSGGNIIGFSKVTRDLSDRKRAEDALKTTAAQLDLKNKTLERVNEELSSFTHVASHDMKEPLRKILAFAARIEDAGFEPEKSRDYIQKIVSSASGLQRLIEDLLSYSHVANDTGAFEMVDLNRVVAAVRSDLEISINEKKAVIVSGELPVIKGISYQLQQLFLNLISNSIKFAKPNEPPRIFITSEIIEGPDIPGIPANGLNKYHHIAISDNGIGFAQEYNRRIFEAFERLHKKDKYPGSGIGLAIVKKIIQNHHGIISAESAPDKGATFHLYLPV